MSFSTPQRAAHDDRSATLNELREMRNSDRSTQFWLQKKARRTLHQDGCLWGSLYRCKSLKADQPADKDKVALVRMVVLLQDTRNDFIREL